MLIRNIISIVFFVFISVISRAEERLPQTLVQKEMNVFFTCDLRRSGSRLKCEDIESLYFGLPGVERAEAREGADLTLNLFALPLVDGSEYIMEFRFKNNQEREQKKVFSVSDIDLKSSYSNEMSTDEELLNLYYDLVRGTAIYLEVLKVEAGRESVSVTYGNPGADPEDPQKGDSTKDWFLSSNLNLFLMKSFVEVQSISSNINANWFKNSWRLQADLSLDYTKQVIPDAGYDVETFSYAGKTVTSYSVDTESHWNVALILSHGHSSKNNLDRDSKVYAGVEWILVPYLTKVDTTGGVRYYVGYEEQEYIVPNIRHNESEKFAKHYLQLFYSSRLGENATYSLSGYASSHISDSDFSSVGADMGVTWRVTDNFSIRGFINTENRKQVINRPAEIDFSDPAQLVLTSGDYSSGSTYHTGVTFTYTFGNSLAKTKDKRWTEFPLE